MNDKDKEEYDKWLEAQNWHYDSFDNEYYQNGLKISIYGETEEAWQAACGYKQKEIDDLIGQLKSCVFVYEEKINRSIAENAKLRSIVRCLAHADASAAGATQIYINNAIQLLKELGDK